MHPNTRPVTLSKTQLVDGYPHPWTRNHLSQEIFNNAHPFLAMHLTDLRHIRHMFPSKIREDESGWGFSNIWFSIVAQFYAKLTKSLVKLKLGEKYHGITMILPWPEGIFQPAKFDSQRIASTYIIGSIPITPHSLSQFKWWSVCWNNILTLLTYPSYCLYPSYFADLNGWFRHSTRYQHGFLHISLVIYTLNASLCPSYPHEIH